MLPPLLLYILKQLTANAIEVGSVVFNKHSLSLISRSHSSVRFKWMKNLISIS